MPSIPRCVRNKGGENPDDARRSPLLCVLARGIRPPPDEKGGHYETAPCPAWLCSDARLSLDALPAGWRGHAAAAGRGPARPAGPPYPRESQRSLPGLVADRLQP